MEQLLSELQQLLVGVSIMQDLTMRAKDSLVSFGERLSTRLFAAFLRKEVSIRFAALLHHLHDSMVLGLGIPGINGEVYATNTGIALSNMLMLLFLCS